MKDKKLTIRQMLLVVIDIVSILIASYGSLLLRFNGSVESSYLQHMNTMIIFIVLIDLAVFVINKLYHSLWQFASIVELKNILISTFCASAVNIALYEVTQNSLPRSCYIIHFLLLTMCVGGSRFSYRLLRFYSNRGKSKRDLERVMIIGAGLAGEKIYREISSAPQVYKEVICFIDDNIAKQQRSLHNVPIVGGRDKIIEASKEYKIEEILVAMPSVDEKDLADILNICKETKCRIKKLPGIYQMLNGDVHLSDFKEVEIKDLLGREPIEVNLEEIMGYVTDKVVMVTGGGGSIGSELCRQIAAAKPKQLIIVDIYENNAYDIQLELKHDYPDLALATFNVFGTLNVARAADKYKTKRFILISTDKAVNPTNVMGATKRMCEMIVQTMNNRSKTEYVAVRFGNVLGSNGSVIPLFKKQIKNGGPVTVTHPDIIRYFMTIPEAVSLVLQAGAYAKGGEIFILDMGKPVKIADMARNLIKLSGYEPDIDIKIEYTGLRPGEKLYEELLMKEEGLQDTPNHLIHIGKPIEMDEEVFLEKLVHLKKEAYDETNDIRHLIKDIVPTYQPKA